MCRCGLDQLEHVRKVDCDAESFLRELVKKGGTVRICSNI